MTHDKKPATSTEIALQQAYRALALADRDRQASIEREQALAKEVRELRKLIDDWYVPHVARLEHANGDLRRRCRDVEVPGRAATAS